LIKHTGFPVFTKARCRHKKALTDTGGGIMLYWALVFFVVSIVAAVFGFTGIAVVTAEIAKILFFIFIVLFIIFLITGILRRPRRGL
jgi:uncharacterized membrane protein YtjA (UPF0391 family)